MKADKITIKVDADVRPLINDLKEVNAQLNKIRNPNSLDTFTHAGMLVLGMMIGMLLGAVLIFIAS